MRDGVVRAIARPVEVSQTAVRRWWWEFGTLTQAAVLYVALVYAALWHAGLPTFRVSGNVAFWEYWTVTASLILLIGAARIAWAAWSEKQALESVVQAAPGALTIAALLPFIVLAFSAWKQALVHIAPFTWDSTLYAVSVALHGRPLWEWFSGVYTMPWLLSAIDVLYAPVWGAVTFGTTAAIAWSTRPQLRRRYFLTLLFMWICLGSVLAAAFGSGGPILYHLFVDGTNPYEPLRRSLEAHPSLVALAVARDLEHVYRANDWHVGAGISAMPSLHVAQATLTALVLRDGRPWPWAVAGWTYVAAITAASVILGWHYAIDGYVSIALTAFFWYLTGLRRSD